MYKKISLILIILLVIILISLVYLYFYFNKEVEVISPDGNEDKVLVDFFERLKNQERDFEAINQKYSERMDDSDVVIARKFEIDVRSCELIKDEEFKQDCLQYLSFEETIKKLDISECDRYKETWRDLCKMFISTTKLENWEECQDIKDKKIHDWCVKTYAYKLNDSKLCYRAFSGIESCFDTNKAINNGWGGDINECADIVKTEYFLLCVNTSNDPCIDLSDEYLIKRCTCVRNYSLIMANGIKEDCAALPLERFKKTCEAYFDNNKNHIDSDGDGINNGLEIFFDTDPFVYEEDAETIAWHEFRWNEVMDYPYYKIHNKIQSVVTDTDDDGLRDYEETEIYKTDPNNRDSDGDGYLDGDEVRDGFDPLDEGAL